MNKIKYCIPFLNNIEGLLRAINSLYTVSTIVPDYITIIDNSGEGIAALTLQPYLDKYTNLHVLPQTSNLGVAASWNTFMKLYDDDIIIANDDVEIHEHTIDLLLLSAMRHENDIFFCGESTSGNAFSFFLLRKAGYCKVGPFDEAFFPAYFEDNDYDYRMRLLGYKIQMVPGVTYTHEGSGTLKRFSTFRRNIHHIEFMKNQQYYLRKWGGLPHEEVFEKAFNERN